jgi:hypothetical protein
MTELTGSSLDDWIYWHFGYNLSSFLPLSTTAQGELRPPE